MAVIDSLASDGFLSARLDSTRADSLFVVLGPRVVVRAVEVLGGSDGLAAGWRTQPGTPYRSRDLRRDLADAARALSQRGFVDATLSPRVVLVSDRLADVTVQVDAGVRAPVVGVELAGGRTPARSFASRRAGVTEPRDAESIDLARIQSALEATGLYASVGTPVLARGADGELVYQVPVVEAPPGAFDLVLGYLPPSGGAGGGVVGRGQVDLRNPLGGGRSASVEIERTPGLASSFSVSASDPFVAGSPLGAGVAFRGTSRDSTLSRQRLAAEIRYPFDLGLELVATLARETVRPGTFGAQEVDGRARVRRTDDVLVGVGVALARLDRVRNPRRGLSLWVAVEQGRRGGEAVALGPGARRRLVVESRGFVPTRRRQTAVIGIDATVTQQQPGGDGLYDEGDLIRFGGAASFRGYDEATFLARSYVRALAEYRVLFDDASFAFAFSDVGAFDRPATPGLEALRRTLIGYGLGVRVQTAIGLATISYALNPDLGVGAGKVHVGLTVGL